MENGQKAVGSPKGKIRRMLWNGAMELKLYCAQSTFTYCTAFISYHPLGYNWEVYSHTHMKKPRFSRTEGLTPSYVKCKQRFLAQNQTYCVYFHMLSNQFKEC